MPLEQLWCELLRTVSSGSSQTAERKLFVNDFGLSEVRTGSAIAARMAPAQSGIETEKSFTAIGNHCPS
jgi:hypothetical protein